MRPLACFLALGALLFFVKRALVPWVAPDVPASTPTLTVRLAADASAADEERAVEEALLVEEAVRRGGALIDPVVRTQLLATMRASHAADVADEDGALLARALSLGLHQADPVARQRLTFQAEQLLAREEPGDPPSDAALTAYLREHAERYRLPARVRVEQLFLSRARRGDRLDADAQRLVALLGRDRDAVERRTLADPSLLPEALEASEHELDVRFGPGFAAALAACAPGVWCGPIASTYGLHVVRVARRGEAVLPELAHVRPRVLADFQHDRRRERVRARLRALRASYRIDVERLRS